MQSKTEKSDISTKNDKVKVNTVKKINTRSNEQWLYGQNQLPNSRVTADCPKMAAFYSNCIKLIQL